MSAHLHAAILLYIKEQKFSSHSFRLHILGHVDSERRLSFYACGMKAAHQNNLQQRPIFAQLLLAPIWRRRSQKQIARKTTRILSYYSQYDSFVCLIVFSVPTDEVCIYGAIPLYLVDGSVHIFYEYNYWLTMKKSQQGMITLIVIVVVIVIKS